MPAFFNGVFGHKPTPGLVDSSGQHPPVVDEIVRYCSSGPLCRYAGDLYPVLRLIASDPSSIADPAKVDLSKVRVYFTESFRTPLVQSVSPEIRRAVRSVHSTLTERCGMIDARDLYLPGFDNAFNIWSSMLYDANNNHFKYAPLW